MKIHNTAGRTGSPLPAVRPDGFGAHGLSRHSQATAEVSRPTNPKKLIVL